MCLGELGHRIDSINVFLHFDIFTSRFAFFGLLDVDSNRFFDGQLDRSLGDEAEICTRETVCLACNIVDIDVVGDGRLAELGLQDTNTSCFIRQRNVDEGVETSRSAKSIVQLFRSVGCADDKDVFLGGHAIHF